ncbi:MAG: transporter [Lentisphaerae bacterium]|nr:transporter [Lentisphaerota bacterium]
MLRSGTHHPRGWPLRLLGKAALYATAALLLIPFLAPAQETAEPLGPNPDEDTRDIRRVFLRAESVLLEPGEIELETGLSYTRSRRLGTAGAGPLNRRLTLPLNFRFGISDSCEGFVSVPASYAYREFSAGEDAAVESSDTVDLGDVQAGLSYVARRETLRVPEIVATLLVRAPTGTDPYGDGGEAAPTGSGHWGVQAGLQLISTTDPVVLYGGLLLQHEFEARGLGQDIQPGNTFGYNVGLGFAVNDDVSLSAQVQGLFQTELELDGETVDGSSLEPYTLRLGVTRRWERNRFIEPSVTFGLNDDAPDVVFGLAYIHQLRDAKP